ncbi:hypothetical protein BB559_005351 [Furculomyces boomerangus]|uniref:Cns1/TTC4 wheel domain-containing protein n=1 Tax=Furculomyces boomerangus TaxID=61424 RepID=A0A2T9Y794_9FUNG|nr:hypothetical protein BB559_005669 [Furculomyces boomerangus]PVU88871.1 hypothetical protein BB559_005351 [Furculomyces boomerangus]
MENTFGPQRERPEWALNPENLDKDLGKVPLFMRDLPENIESEENVQLQAIQSLVYEGPPEEIAENFKEQGNDCFKSKRYADATKYYTQGLDQEFENDKLKEALYLNRAAANLEQQNYRKVINDCSAALKINNKNVKALYRAARALFALEKMAEAIDCCQKGLEIDSGNKNVSNLLGLILKKQEEIERQNEIRRNRFKKQFEEKQSIDEAIKSRGIKLVSTDIKKSDKSSTHYYIGEHKRLRAEWENKSGNLPRINSESGNLEWPVFFFYPEFKESDFVEHFDEKNTLYDLLETILEQPPPFDNMENPRYTVDNINTYFTYLPPGSIPNNDSELLVKVNINTQLEKILTNPKYTVSDGIPNFIVLPKSGEFTEEFLDMYRKRRQSN